MESGVLLAVILVLLSFIIGLVVGIRLTRPHVLTDGDLLPSGRRRW